MGAMEGIARIQVIDSHTEGEPTRVVIAGGPDLGDGTVAEQARVMRERFDWFRSTVVNEPRGFDAMVGALLVQPRLAGAATGVIFFNNVGLLQACGHGTLGVAATLAHLGRIGAGSHAIETPVGAVTVRLDPRGGILLDNVPAFRHATAVPVEVEFQGRRRRFTGDVAWGGNWFFLCSDHGEALAPAAIDRLTALTSAIQDALTAQRITGAGGAAIDHVELFGPPSRKDCDSRNFVLCPGRQYDRSPCGTGTSAKMACLFADGVLREGDRWRQESIIGSRFEGSVRLQDGRLIPTISGAAHVTAESTLIVHPRDPFGHGIAIAK